MSVDDYGRRLDKIEREQEKMEEAVQQLILSTTRIGDLMEAQKSYLPKLDALQQTVHEQEVRLSNAQLVQRAVVWVGSIVGSSAVVMALSYLFSRGV